ncbi:MAG: hypothetical protein DRJ96_01590 [Thermoprotei archaeon]|nr:DUF2208 family protein [Thermoproteales archaeon]RLE98250.1 MAG: hypothetical protein DRJ96_01590 [Thermoprotei archaeon]
MRRALNVAMSAVLLLLFSFVTSYYPGYLSLMFILYIVTTLAISLAVAGRGAVRMVRDLEYVRGGKRLLHVSREVVERLRRRDRELGEELGKQHRASLVQMTVLIAAMTVFLIPSLRDAAIMALRGVFEPLGLDPKMTQFLVFLALYGVFFLASNVASILSSRSLEKLGGPLQVPAFYTVTSRGLILEGRVPIKAPLSPLEVEVNTRRRFLELRVRSPSASGLVSSATSRIRLYYENPRELESYLRMLSKERG